MMNSVKFNLDLAQEAETVEEGRILYRKAETNLPKEKLGIQYR